jgi:membrane protein
MPGSATRLKEVLAAAAAEARHSLLALQAASLAFATLLSLVPLLAVAFSMLKAFGAHNLLEPVLLQALAPLGERGTEVARQIIGFVDNLRVGVLGAAGLAGLLLTVVSLIEKVEHALNRIWRVRWHRTFARKLADYLSVVVVGPALVGSALAITASLQTHRVVLALREIEPMGRLFELGTRVLPLVFAVAGFTFLYKLLPHTRVRLRSAAVGGLTAGLLWQLAGVLFATFVVGSAQYTAVYSSFAILVLFLIWLQLAWLIVLAGAEVAYFHQHPAAARALLAGREPGHPSRERLGLEALHLVARRHLGGEPPAGVDRLASLLGVPETTLADPIEALVARGLLVRTRDPDGVALTRAPELIGVAQILAALRDPAVAAPGAARPGAAAAAVSEVLGLRDAAVKRALASVTLRTLAAGTGVPARPEGRTEAVPPARSGEGAPAPWAAPRARPGRPRRRGPPPGRPPGAGPCWPGSCTTSPTRPTSPSSRPPSTPSTTP